MNNKKFFSVKMFWQSYKQLKAIGITATVLILVLGIFPIVLQVIDTKMMLKMYADNPNVITNISATVVDVMNMHGYLCIMFMIFTPLFTLNTWKFLNKRNTSDFYHALPYTRECLFLSKAGAVVAWLLEVFIVSFVGTTLAYLVFTKYFIIDHLTLFRLHVAMFGCSLLVFGAISVACAVTGNMFNNICVSGIIIFLPRIMVSLVSSAVSSMVHIVPVDSAISFINNMQNIVTSWTFTMVGGDVELQELVLSGGANVYTYLLAIIYIVCALLLFKVRKSECAGKATYGKAIGFAIKFVIGFGIASIGTISAVVNAYTTVEQSELETFSYVYAVISMMLISAVVVVVYEFFSTRHFFKFKRCILPILSGWVFAGVLALGINVAADSILAYKPAKDDMDYVIITKEDSNYYYDTGIDYFETIAKNTKITDEKILDTVSVALKHNIDKVKNNEYDEFYGYHMSWDDKPKEGYACYRVYIKDGLLGKYRTIYFSYDQEKALISDMQNVKEYKDAYYDLPSFENASVTWYAYNDFPTKENKELYDVFLEELKTVKFEDYYACTKEGHWSATSLGMLIQFSRDGYIYNAELQIDRDTFPKTMAKYFELNNKIAMEKNATAIQGAKTLLKDYIEKDIDPDKDFKYKYVDVEVFMPDGETSIYTDGYYAMQNEEVKKVLFPAVLKAMESDSKSDFSADDKLLVRVSYSDDTDMTKYVYVTYFVQIDKDIDINWDKLMQGY